MAYAVPPFWPRARFWARNRSPKGGEWSPINKRVKPRSSESKPPKCGRVAAIRGREG